MDDVFCSIAPDGARMVKVRLRCIRRPQIGDKFSSRHGQKGVIGKMLKDHELPRGEDGIAPDLIMNPHALPSRMTIGHLAEMLSGLVATETGEVVDATMFTGETIPGMLETCAKNKT